jgi:hypothetical protein
MGDTEETNTLTICPPNTTDTSGCVTRQIGSTIDIAGQCISKQGWMTAIGTPACEGVEAAAPPTSFTTPEQLASLYPLKRNMSGVAPRARREANAMLTDATAAADSLWENAQNVFIQGAWFKNVTAEEVPRMQELYGADWTPALQALVDAGELIQMDFMMCACAACLPQRAGLRPASAQCPIAHRPCAPPHVCAPQVRGHGDERQ